MAEIPEHLLKRAQARRAALTGGEAPAEGGSGPTAPKADAGPAASVPAKVAPAAPSLPAVAPKVSRPDALPPSRARMPFWMMPVFGALPIFVFFYGQGYQTQPKPVETNPAIVGPAVYKERCSSCHGAAGEGNVGPKLTGGEAKLTFPDEKDHVAWVKGGSSAVAGQKYGDPKRAGGARVATGGMPAFGGTLSAEEIDAVVAYERDTL